MGWTQHTTGTQIIRAASMIQLLLGNIGMAGGGVNALRGESNVQGITDHALLFHILPGYMPAVNAALESLEKYNATTPKTSDPMSVNWWGNRPKYIASLLKSFYGENATKENDWGYGWLPKLDVGQNAAWLFLFDEDLYGGVEYSYRNIEEPIFEGEEVELQKRNGKERLSRAYLYWTPHKSLAFSGEYQYERLDGHENVFQATHVKTHRFPLGINLFHPSGFNATVRTTYLDQEGEFMHQKSGARFSGSDQFWLVEASISYRLPKRFGLITVGAKNLFDDNFKYHYIDYENPVIQPKRLIFARLTLALWP